MARPKSDWFSLSLGKFSVRTLVELLTQELNPRGVQVASVPVTEAVAPGTAYDPDLIAELYTAVHS
jgi:hypothetical protein